ncbi:hypothetical protein V6615_09290 [Oscillospiraceae bacterium PP1C4]
MNEERRMILEMLQNGTITVEEAERLMEALKTKNEITPFTSVKGVSPKRILVHVTENGKTKVNVRIPFSLVRVGLKLGQSFSSLGAKYSVDYSAEAELIKSIDIDEVLDSLSSGEISLPYTMVDVDDEKNQHVQIIME